MAAEDRTLLADAGYAEDADERIDIATTALSDVTNGLCMMHRLADMAIGSLDGDPSQTAALLGAVRDMARTHARKLDRCAAIIGGGPAVGCFADDLANE